MKEGNEEARQTEGDNGQGDRGRRARRARTKLADREGRAARGNGERKKERGTEKGERVDGWLARESKGVRRRKRAEGRKRDR